MFMDIIIETISQFGVIPVIKLDRSSDAFLLGDSLVSGGLPVAEVTFRTDAAEESIRIMSRAFPDVVLGAGTVLKIDQVKTAVDAGAQFIVSPGFSPKVVEYCLDQKIPVLPGVMTPTEIQNLLDYGLEVAKFFPAEQAGGVRMVEALAAPFAQVRFIPTGGITPENLLSYISQKCVIACGGSWMVRSELIQKGEFNKIRDLVVQALLLTKQSTTQTL